MSDLLTVGKVAKKAGVNIQTVRYYERRGILLPEGRRESGYRIYTEDAVRKIRFIKKAQELGFTLREVEQLLRLRVSDRARCGDIKRRTEAKLRDVQLKISGLHALERVLKDLVKSCRVQATTDRCPVLKTLEVDGDERRTQR